MVSSLKFTSMTDENSVGKKKRCGLHLKNNVDFMFLNGKTSDIFHFATLVCDQGLSFIICCHVMFHKHSHKYEASM